MDFSKPEYAVTLIIITIAILLFMSGFEARKPKSGEVVLLAVMISLAVTGRMVFFMLPQFKPMAAIIIITAVTMGKEAGFLCGALSVFVSNMFFGQGPWTPFQMFAFGMVGLVSGVLFKKMDERVFKGQGSVRKEMFRLAAAGGVMTLVIYGMVMDTASVMIYTDGPAFETILASYAAGLPFNLMHGFSTFIFLIVMGKPFIKKISRVKNKYGMYKPLY